MNITPQAASQSIAMKGRALKALINAIERIEYRIGGLLQVDPDWRARSGEIHLSYDQKWQAFRVEHFSGHNLDDNCCKVVPEEEVNRFWTWLDGKEAEARRVLNEQREELAKTLTRQQMAIDQLK